jgi:hypothetical protein
VAAGHDGVARELADRLRQDGHHVECHDFAHLVPGGWGRRLRAAYRRQLEIAPSSWGWLLRALQRSRLLAALVSMLAASSRQRLLDVSTGHTGAGSAQAAGTLAGPAGGVF